MNIAAILKTATLIATATSTAIDAVRGVGNRWQAWRQARRDRRDAEDHLRDVRIIAAEVAELDRILNEKTGE